MVNEDFFRYLNGFCLSQICLKYSQQSQQKRIWFKNLNKLIRFNDHMSNQLRKKNSWLNKNISLEVLSLRFLSFGERMIQHFQNTNASRDREKRKTRLLGRQKHRLRKEEAMKHQHWLQKWSFGIETAVSAFLLWNQTTIIDFWIKLRVEFFLKVLWRFWNSIIK